MLLAIETAVGDGSVALWRDGKCAGERALARGRRHAASLLRAIDELLGGAPAALGGIDAIALSIGPGSFTALRIGLATALGLCFGSARRIVAVPTLAALAAAAPRDAERVGALLDARKAQVYAGLYAPDGRALAPDAVVDPADWAAGLAGHGPLTAIGPGLAVAEPALRAALGRNLRIAPLPPHALAREVARLGAAAWEAGGGLAPESVELRYLRPPDAQLPA